MSAIQLTTSLCMHLAQGELKKKAERRGGILNFASREVAADVPLAAADCPSEKWRACKSLPSITDSSVHKAVHRTGDGLLRDILLLLRERQTRQWPFGAARYFCAGLQGAVGCHPHPASFTVVFDIHNAPIMVSTSKISCHIG
jgi:hypothetical protein